jgi:hypothetical protein
MALRTVVMPREATWASWAIRAGREGQREPRGWRCFSRLSVCSSTQPGKRKWPSQSIATLAWVGPSEIWEMTPLTVSREPGKMPAGPTIWQLVRSMRGILLTIAKAGYAGMNGYQRNLRPNWTCRAAVARHT